jgi:hypothetical protein
VPSAAAGQVRARVAGGGPGRERRARWASAAGLGKGARSWARVRAVSGKRLGLSQFSLFLALIFTIFYFMLFSFELKFKHKFAGYVNAQPE